LRCFANKQAWLDFGDLYTEDSAPVVLNCRTDAVRDQLHKTLRQLFDSDGELGRNLFLALFDRSVVRSPQEMYKNDGCLVVSRGKPNHGLNIRCAEFASGTREAKSSPISQLLRESAVTFHSVTAL
jgi:hypothetical protein